MTLFFFKEVRLCGFRLADCYLTYEVQSATSLPRPVAASEGIPFGSSLEKPLPLRQILTYPVLICVANIACFEFLDSSRCSLLPLFLAMPIEIGGLGFDPRHIGYILGVYGAAAAVFMATYFPKIVRYLGERRTYVLAMSIFHVAWVLFPVMNLCARQYGISTRVWMGIVLWIVPAISTEMAYGSFPIHVLGADDVISTSRVYLDIPHCSGTQQAFAGSNSWPFPDGYFDSAHYSPFVVDISLFVLRGTQSSWRLCGVRRLLDPHLFCGVGCNEIARRSTPCVGGRRGQPQS